jgi:hypothetical protein
MQGELNVVWDYLLPAFHDKPLPEAAAEPEKLKATLAKLEVKPGHVANVLKLPGAATAPTTKPLP